MEICDLSEFDDEWPLKKETTDIWEELDTIVSTFETSNFLGKGKCKDRIDIRQLPLPRSVSPDCNKISSSAWNSQPRKPPSYDQPQQHESSNLTRPFCRQTGGRAIPEAWGAARVVPKRPDHDYSQQLSLHQQALQGVYGGSQGRIGAIDLCCDNFDGNDGPSGQKAGKVGAPWRHVKSAVGAVGEQFAFVDGSVRIRDGCTLDRMSSAGGDGQFWSAISPSSRCKSLKPTFVQAPKTMDNGFAERARLGKVYWYVDKKPQLCVGGLRRRRRPTNGWCP